MNMYNEQSNQENSNVINNNQPSINQGKKKKIIITIIVGIIVLAVAIFMVIKFMSKSSTKSQKEFDITKSDAFFIENDDRLSALFNQDGKQLTDFEFSNMPRFVNNAALVERKVDSKRAVVTNEGKYLIEFGRCEYLFQNGFLFECSNFKTDEHFIMDAKGKILFDGLNYSVEDGEVDELSFVADKEKKEISVYLYDGTVLTTIPYVDNIFSSSRQISSNKKDGFITTFYNDKTYIFDLINKKFIISVEGYYRLDSYNENNRNEFVLRDASYGTKENERKNLYIKDGKVAYTTPKKLEILNSSLILDEKQVIDENGNSILDIEKKVIFDDKNYASKENDFVSIYVKGNKKTQTSCEIVYEMSNEIYRLNDCDDSFKYAYYNINGDKIGDYYKRAEPYDENGNAVVQLDQKYFLINKKGERISDEYDEISSVDKGAFYYTSDNKILDKNGKVFISGKYSRSQRDYFVVTSDDGYKLVNIDTNKIISIDYSYNKDKNSSFVDYDNYLKIKDDSGVKYYSTTTGKMIYESK